MRLIPLPEGGHELWTVEYDFFTFGLHFPGRMTVVRLPSGDLWLVNPVPVDDALAIELDRLGPVKWLVGPNRFHHVHIAQVKGRYRDARVFGAPGLPEKRQDLAFDGTLGDEPHEAWQDVIQQVVLRSIPSFNEVVFFHKPSKTLIGTDLVMNVHSAKGPLGWLPFWLEGAWRRPRVPRLYTLLARNRKAIEQEVETILSWPVKHVIMAHGDVLYDAPDFIPTELPRAFRTKAPERLADRVSGQG